jgi:O-antigen biosynthesis alpha-1,2-rhamnosyltransferase
VSTGSAQVRAAPTAGLVTAADDCYTPDPVASPRGPFRPEPSMPPTPASPVPTVSSSTAPRPRRIYVDCTETAMTRRVTGIQRVVRNIVRHGRAAAQALGAECVPVRFSDGGFRTAGPLACVAGAAGVFRLAGTAASRRAGVARRLSPRAIAAKLSHASQAAIGGGLAIDWRPGDVLLLADASWERPLWFAVSQARAAGVVVGTVQYDLIPILHPDLVPEGLTAAFSRWMEKAVRSSDFFACISESVRRQMIDYTATGGPSAARCGERIFSVPLGSDLDAAAGRKIRRAVRVPFDRNDGAGTYIVVGTIEPRKNQALALQAFELLWRRSHDASLVLVGKRGWGSEPLVQHVRSHPRFGENLFLVDDATDAELRWCYRRARALVFPSKAEGFGLPIAEAMRAGLPVFASEIPVHWEVGGSHCRFFDPSNPFELARLVEAFERQTDAPATWSDDGFPRWSACIRQWFAQCLDAAEDASRTAERRAA